LTGKLTPMMEQYLAIKDKHPDKIVFFQVGDFYEMFYRDAEIVSRELDLILTTRDVGKENPVPLAGVPVHAASGYSARLVEKGYKVVICDQVEDASLAKGLVTREVTRIITPGTVTDQNMLEDNQNNYLLSLVKDHEKEYYGLALADISTGGFWVTEITGENENPLSMLKGEWQRIQPSECICPRELYQETDIINQCLQVWDRVLVEEVSGDYFETEHAWMELSGQWKEDELTGLHPKDYPLAVAAGGALLSYVKGLYQNRLQHLRPAERYSPGEYMVLDGVTRRNLELVQTIREGKRKGSLLGVLDNTCTSMGSRLLKRWVEQPLKDIAQIKHRSEGVEELYHNASFKEELGAFLKNTWDLERLCGRMNFGNVNPRDLLAIKKSLGRLPEIKETLGQARSRVLQETCSEMPLFHELVDHLYRALVDDPPMTLNEGGIIREGYHEEVDQLRTVCRDGKNWLLDLEKKERERTGIKSLKVSYNRVFGYYIEVTKTNLHLVPTEYHRKQTLVNAERYITEELKKMEEQITGADQKLVRLEQTLFEELRQRVLDYIEGIQKAAFLLAKLDGLQSLAEAAAVNRYVRPAWSDQDKLEIKEGRHPVVENMNLGERFVPNDVHLDENEKAIILTGPNMAGKSTYCRSVALNCLMGQMGGFVPAEAAHLPVLDRIFARVGASDDLSRGESTFMVEMNEAASILKESTPRTLVVLDEIGRGTSTYDGMSIARSVLEYLQENIGSWTLFSTHYHELTVLEDELEGVKNYTVAVKEKGSTVVFLRKVLPGRADRSYGINVARLAGLPEAVIDRAQDILEQTEKTSREVENSRRTRQLSFLDLSTSAGLNGKEKEVIDELKELSPDQISPREALQKLYQLQEKIIYGKGAKNIGGN